MIKKFWTWLCRRYQPTAYYTIDGGNLCPHPDMTDEDLKDYEKWADSL